MRILDIKQARALVLQSQLLNPDFSRKGKEATLEAIEHLGYVQIDTLSVVARAHHHVLRSRITDYQADYLKALEEEERKVFEYWAHAASYLPMKDYRFSLPRKTSIGSGDGFWYEKQPKLMNYILDRLKAEGPLMSRDFKNPEKKKKTTVPVWSSNPMKRALHQLFMEGQIMVQSRKGFQKVFDLTERVLPDHVNRALPSREEYIDYLILRDIRAHRLIKGRDIGHLIKNIKPALKERLKAMVLAGQIEAIQVKGQEGEHYYALPEMLDHIPKVHANQLKILSPFDNLLIQRRRTEELFDFKYTLECYVPAAKRIVGYFSLPLLLGTNFVGQMDAKVDRKTKILWIKNLVWEPKIKPTKKLEQAFRKAIKAFAKFNDCGRVELIPALKNKTIIIDVGDLFFD